MTRTEVDLGDPRIETGAAWDAFCRALEASKQIVLGEGVPDSPQLRAEGFRYLTRFLEAGIRTCVEYTDSDHPEFCRMIERGMTWGLDCPDCLYLYAPVRGDAEYRICGTRGSANYLDLQVNYGHFAFGDIGEWGTISSLSGVDLELAADDSFEIALAAQARPGNWLRLAPDAEFVLVRQYFDDWESERPGDLRIERLPDDGGDGGSASAAPPRTDQMADRLERLTQWLARGGALWESMSRGLVAGSTNRLSVFKPSDEDARGGLAGQVYGMGGFHCEPGEALIVSFTPPDCRHWNLSLASWYWESIDYATRQSSLNRSQAKLDADGVFRGVIAHEDPGVPNWLDPGGHVQGTLAARFLRAEAVPSVELTRIPLADLRSRLPAETPHVSAAERAQQLVRRHRAVLGRYRR